jgi:deoxycytidine triphosphate deaminase
MMWHAYVALVSIELDPELDATRLPAPVLAVQVTRSSVGGGGRTVHNAVVDGHSVW